MKNINYENFDSVNNIVFADLVIWQKFQLERIGEFSNQDAKYQKSASDEETRLSDVYHGRARRLLLSQWQRQQNLCGQKIM